ncbi:MAG: hypothetical protein K9G58_10420 [Bacteroidales bacterium]|nr:hypothetical protein [Bacteroidales bacterium]MCF8386965.1 hypothetical protein [Bacteroidales bacterium]MCF8398575.1 hypothetical protein [Bacteroidales bacterium]
MLTRNKYILLIILLVFVKQSGIIAQHTRLNQNASVYNVLLVNSDSLYGANDKLVNGSLYDPLHSMAAGHPYYPKESFQVGDIAVLGEIFTGEKIKFNIELQKLVLKKLISKGATTEILLNNTLVDSFSIRNKKFINLFFLPLADSLQGFAEVIFDGEFGFYAYHKKILKDDYTRKTPYGRYQELSPRYFLIMNQNVKTIRKKRDFLKIFKGQRKEIRKFMKKQNIKYKNASSSELARILKYGEKNIGK